MRKLLLLLVLVPSLAAGQSAKEGIIRYYPPSGSSGASVSGNNAFLGTNSFAGSTEFDGPTFWGGTTAAFQQCRWNTAQTPDTFTCGLATGSHTWVFHEAGDEGFDFAHPLQTNPTLFVHSSAQSTTQWIGLSHDGTRGAVSTGAGGVGFPPGTAAEPGIGFALDLDGSGTGLYRPSGNQFALSISGTPTSTWVAASILRSGSGMNYCWTTGDSSATHDTCLKRLSANVIAQTTGTVTTIGSMMGGGAAVASADPLPAPTGLIFHVTGTTSFTNLTTTNLVSGACFTMIFDGILTVTDGGNLKLASTYVTTADDTLSVCYDGTSFYETTRSVN